MSAILFNSSVGNVTVTVNDINTEIFVLTVFILFMSIFTMVSNSILLRIFYMYPSLRHDKKYTIQIWYIISQLLFGFGTAIATTDGLRIMFINDWYTAYSCLIIHSGPFIWDLFSICIVLIMASDRFIAVQMPFYYRNLNKRKFARFSILSCFAFTMTCFGFSFIDVDNNMKPLFCTGSGARNVKLKPLLSYLKCTVGSLTVILYTLIFITFRCKIKQKNRLINKMDKSTLTKNESKKTGKLVSTVIIVCFSCSILPSIVVSLITMRKFNAHRIGPYTTVLGLCDSTLNLIIFLWRDKKIRRAFHGKL